VPGTAPVEDYAMRIVGLLLIFLSIPILIALIGRDVRRRDLAVLAAGVLMFCTGPLEVTASLISWPGWQGLSKGMILSVLDSIAIALIATRSMRFNRAPFIPLIAIFAFPIVLSVTQAAVKQAAFFMVFQILQMTVYYIALSGELHRLSAIRSLMKGLALGLMIQAGYVLWQKASGMVQAPGTTGHQNILGIMVELSALPLLAAALEGERSKLVYAGLFAAMIVIAGGGSRGAMLYFAVGAAIVLVLSLIRRSTPRKWQFLGLIALAGLVAAPLAMATLKDRFGDTPVTTEETQRAAMERAARAMAADHWLGVGANNFVSVNNTQGYAARAGMDWGPANRSKPAHNAYLVARAETGWAGEIALILFFGGLAVAGYRAGFQMRELQYVGLPLGCAAAITAVALHSNYEYAILMSESQRLIFMNAAIIAGCLEIMRRARAERRRATVRRSASVPAPATEAV
jgi:hypothetical protein